jgi:hypothetical protein
VDERNARAPCRLERDVDADAVVERARGEAAVAQLERVDVDDADVAAPVTSTGPRALTPV